MYICEYMRLYYMTLTRDKRIEKLAYITYQADCIATYGICCSNGESNCIINKKRLFQYLHQAVPR